MNFTPTPEQETLIRTLRAFARKELAPRSPHWDRSGEFPGEAWKRMGELRLFELRAPVEHGGQEADLVTTGIAIEEIDRADLSSMYEIQLAALGGEIIGRNGSDEIRKRWLPPVISGEIVLAIALTESGVGSDAAGLACRAMREGDEYVITVEKSGISLGIAAHAVMLFATTDPDARARGVTAFLVTLDRPGVVRSPPPDLSSRAIARAASLRSRAPAELTTTQCDAPATVVRWCLRLQPRAHRACTRRP